MSSVAVPSFWSIELNSAENNGAYILLTLVGTVFGAIHCAAWNAVFPTHAEMWIWRTSSLAIVAIPGLYLSIPLRAITTSDQLDWAFVVVSVIAFLASPIYIAARILLIVLPLVELRSLPASAFVDVNWSTYIPHI